MNKKSYSFDLDTFRNILQICPKLHGRHFVDTPFEEDILAFMREIGYSGTIKLHSDVKVDLLPQPWRTFATIINKCLSSKVTGIDTLRLSRAQILWGLYHQEKVNFVYLLWEDLVYQIENKESRKNKYMYYPRFTKVVISHFMSQDQSIPRRNKVDWHMANDDPILTTMRFIPQHEVVQKYGAILPDYLTNPAMKASEAYKTYHDLANGKVQPKPKYVRRSSRSKTDDAPKPSSGKRVKAIAKVAKGSGAHEGTGVKPGVPDVPIYRSDDEEEIPCKSSEEDDNDDNEDDNDDQGVPNDDQGDDNDSERTVSDTEGDDFVHPKFTSHDVEERHDEEDKDEESFDPRVQTPSHYEPSDDEANDDLAQSGYAEVEEVNFEQTFEANINLEGRDAEMTDAPKTNQVIKDTHVTLTLVNPEGQQHISSVSSGFISNMLNPNPDTGIDSVLKVETTSLVDVPVTSQATTTLPQPSNLLLPPVPTLTLATTPNNHQGTQDFCIVNARVKKEVSKILPRIEKLVNEQLEYEVLIRTSHEAKSTHAVAANLSELELKKILIDKMESNKSIDRSDEQKNLYKALVDAYAADKDLLDAYGDTVTIKRRRDEADDDQEPSAGTDRGSKRRRAGKEPESSSAPKETTSKSTGKSTEGSKSRHQSAGQSAPAEEPIHTEDDFEEPTHQEFETGVNDDQPEDEIHPHPDWFQKPTRLPSPDRDWNKTLPADHGPVQPWLSNLARQEDPRESFDELMDTPLDFSAFVMNRLKVDTLTPELLAGPTFELMKGTCKSLVELEYFFEEVYKATTEQLDWTNPEGQQYPHDLRKPLPLISNTRGRQVIPFDHFINNDLAYLSGGVSSRKYATSVTKTKAADYGNIKWIEDLVPNSIWSEVPVSYDKYALWGISHWGRKRQHFYGYAANRESAKDVYSRRRIIAVTKLQIIEWHGYKHLDWITVRRDDDKLYSFKDGNLKRLRLQDIEDLIFLVQ
ncbi:hypothetical protein Tco_0479072 [Tanacetum coccineum]